MRNQWIPWAIIVLLVVAYVLGRVLPKEPEPCRIVRDTVTVRDTVRDSIPKPFVVRFDHWDTLYIPLYITDTLRLSDNVLLPVPIPIERKEYRTDDYRAVISGYKPNLDVMEVFRKTQTIIVTPKAKRWGVGPQIGVGYPGGWYVGVGASYHVWQW